MLLRLDVDILLWGISTSIPLSIQAKDVRGKTMEITLQNISSPTFHVDPLGVSKTVTLIGFPQNGLKPAESTCFLGGRGGIRTPVTGSGGIK